MTMTRFEDGIKPTSIHRTSDGYLTARVRCARPGVQTYTRKELNLEGDPHELVGLYRPPEMVFDAASMETYAGKPITMGHPKEDVSAENWKSLSIGTTGNKVIRDGDYVVVDLAIMDADAITQVEAGTREVSMGYRAPIAAKDGFSPQGERYHAIQVGPSSINHLAVVLVARGGPDLRIGDAAPDQWGATPKSNEEFNMSTKHVVLGDAAVTLPLADAAILEQFKINTTKLLDEALAKAKKVEEEKDEEIGKLKAEKKALADAAITPAKLTAMIKDRVALETQAKGLVPTMVCDGMSDVEIKKGVVVAKLGDSAVTDVSDAELNGMYKVLVRAADSADDSMREALSVNKQTIITDGASGAWGDNIAAAAGVKFKKKGA